MRNKCMLLHAYYLLTDPCDAGGLSIHHDVDMSEGCAVRSFVGTVILDQIGMHRLL